MFSIPRKGKTPHHQGAGLYLWCGVDVMELGGCRLLADAVEVLADDLSEGLEA